ncbi:hypothetical protein Ocin01_19079 [Orchesella cincta]|uniref:Uncharacterized protein n=1 Tax=Orchesella cincta TaxID=48709 RepID=A0A1D2M3Q0_ORCCI|nr:hypothetical protein Ocin01_19079 [Orchesella cincta]
MLPLLLFVLLIVLEQTQGQPVDSADDKSPTKRWKTIGTQDFLSRWMAQDSKTATTLASSQSGIRSGGKQTNTQPTTTATTPFPYRETTSSTLRNDESSTALELQRHFSQCTTNSNGWLNNVATEATTPVVESNIVADIQEAFKHPQTFLSTVIKTATQVFSENQDTLQESRSIDVNVETTKQPATTIRTYQEEPNKLTATTTPFTVDLTAKIFEKLQTSVESILPLFKQGGKNEQTTTKRPGNSQGFDMEGILKMFNIDGSKASLIIEFFSKNNLNVLEVLRDSNVSLGEVLDIFQTGDFSSKKTQDILMKIAMQIMMKKSTKESETTEPSFDASALIKTFMEMTMTTTTPAPAGCNNRNVINQNVIMLPILIFTLFYFF